MSFNVCRSQYVSFFFQIKFIMRQKKRLQLWNVVKKNCGREKILIFYDHSTRIDTHTRFIYVGYFDDEIYIVAKIMTYIKIKNYRRTHPNDILKFKTLFL